MELTDDQLVELAKYAIWETSTADYMYDEAVVENLVQLGLLRYDKADPWKHRRPYKSSIHVCNITTLGYELLQKNRVRALSRFKWQPTIDRAFEYFKDLSIAELPSLLMHHNTHTRSNAKERMEELLNGTN